MRRRPGCFGFLGPVVLLTIGSWGFLLAALFLVSLARPMEVLPAFKRWVLPYSAGVAAVVSVMAWAVLWRSRNED